MVTGSPPTLDPQQHGRRRHADQQEGGAEFLAHLAAMLAPALVGSAAVR
jgi:hypothetical protein